MPGQSSEKKEELQIQRNSDKCYWNQRLQADQFSLPSSPPWAAGVQLHSLPLQEGCLHTEEHGQRLLAGLIGKRVFLSSSNKRTGMDPDCPQPGYVPSPGPITLAKGCCIMIGLVWATPHPYTG